MGDTFSFVHFNPRKEFEACANKYLGEIIERCPSDATCEAEVRKTNGGYVFRVTIESPLAQFVVIVELEDMKKKQRPRNWQVPALESLKRQMFELLDEWTAKRFQASRHETYQNTRRIAA